MQITETKACRMGRKAKRARTWLVEGDYELTALITPSGACEAWMRLTDSGDLAVKVGESADMQFEDFCKKTTSSNRILKAISITEEYS